MNDFSIWIPGRPQPKGSVRAYKSRVIQGTTKAQEERIFAWQSTVGLAVKERWPHGVVEEPVEVRMAFLFARPLAHWGQGRNADRLRPSAPEYHTSTPDVDKLARAILDALQGIVYQNDSNVFELSAVKMWVPSRDHEPGVSLRIASVIQTD